MRLFLQVSIRNDELSFFFPHLSCVCAFIFISTGAQRQQDSLELGVAKLECTVENLNLRLARLLGEYASSQAKLKQRISKLEDR